MKPYLTLHHPASAQRYYSEFACHDVPARVPHGQGRRAEYGRGGDEDIRHRKQFQVRRCRHPDHGRRGTDDEFGNADVFPRFQGRNDRRRHQRNPPQRDRQVNALIGGRTMRGISRRTSL
ncbi:hypothetical protein chiPu_0029802, partial [Chiloscyllium punctatum]|nr:hypothetical protein [Chiloscyllium punctatum]